MRRLTLPPWAWALFLALPLVAGASKASLERARARVQARALASGLAFPLEHPALRVQKSQHRLELRSGDQVLKAYGIALGHRGLADKRREGDHLTPEGDFYICTRGEQSAFHLFLGLSYPGIADAERGAREGLITGAQRRAILEAQRRKTCPPWNTRLGGMVGLHGGGTESEWTWGCIALSDEDIEELWTVCPLGTPVRIEP